MFSKKNLVYFIIYNGIVNILNGRNMAVKNQQLAKESTAFQFSSYFDGLHPKSKLECSKKTKKNSLF